MCQSHVHSPWNPSEGILRCFDMAHMPSSLVALLCWVFNDGMPFVDAECYRGRRDVETLLSPEEHQRTHFHREGPATASSAGRQ